MSARKQSRRDPGAGSRGVIFVVSSNVEKVNPATRKLIRSHVMQGKRQTQKTRRIEPWTVKPSRSWATAPQLEEVCVRYATLLPGRVGSDLSFLEFAARLEPSTISNIVQFSRVACRVMFPMMVATGLQADDAAWLYPMTQDDVSLHITVFAAEEFIRRILCRQQTRHNPPAMLHLQRGLKLLQARLAGDDKDTKISNDTITVITKLACTAHFDGEHEMSRQHMAGLRKMVDLRGGLEVFAGTMLQTEMLRCDLRIALLGASTTVFYRQPYEPLPPYPRTLLPPSDDEVCCSDNAKLIREMDKDLAIAWKVLRRFCFLVNLGTQTQRLVTPNLVHETMAAVMYRLLLTNFDLGSINEALRQGLLAFSYHTFMQWTDVKLPRYHNFLASYQNCILKLQQQVNLEPRLMLWLVITGANAMFDVQDDAWLGSCLREFAERSQVKTWKQMREVLKSFLWIAVLDEKQSKQTYDLYLS